MRYLVFLVFTVLVSCKNDSKAKNLPENKKEHLQEAKFKKVDSFIITSQELALQYDVDPYYITTDTQEYLIGLDLFSGNVEIINLTNKTVKIVDISNIPEVLKYNIVEGFDDIFVADFNDIYLLATANKVVFNIDFTGKLKQIIDLKNAVKTNQSENFSEIVAVARRNFVVNNYVFYFRSIPPLNWYVNASFYTKPFLSEYNNTTKKFIKSFGNFSKITQTKNSFFPADYQNSFVLNFKDNLLVVSDRREDFLYIYDIKTGDFLEKFLAKSKYFDASKVELLPRKIDMQKFINSMRKDGSYFNLLYNPHKNEYYRIVVHNQNLIDEKTKKLKHPINNRSFSVIVLDNNFKYKGEAYFDGKKFNYLSFCVNKNGLMFYYTDPKNEDTKHFTTIDFTN